jgi:hypothetical protein
MMRRYMTPAEFAAGEVAKLTVTTFPDFIEQFKQDHPDWKDRRETAHSREDYRPELPPDTDEGEGENEVEVKEEIPEPKKHPRGRKSVSRGERLDRAHEDLKRQNRKAGDILGRARKTSASEAVSDKSSASDSESASRGHRLDKAPEHRKRQNLKGRDDTAKLGRARSIRASKAIYSEESTNDSDINMEAQTNTDVETIADSEATIEPKAIMKFEDFSDTYESSDSEESSWQLPEEKTIKDAVHSGILAGLKTNRKEETEWVREETKKHDVIDQARLYLKTLKFVANKRYILSERENYSVPYLRTKPDPKVPWPDSDSELEENWKPKRVKEPKHDLLRSIGDPDGNGPVFTGDPLMDVATLLRTRNTCRRLQKNSRTNAKVPVKVRDKIVKAYVSASKKLYFGVKGSISRWSRNEEDEEDEEEKFSVPQESKLALALVQRYFGV